MISSPMITKRLLVPRWRNLLTTIASGELSNPSPSIPKEDEAEKTSYYDEKLEQWNTRKNIVSAGELVEAAIVSDLESTSFPAAEYLLRPSIPATSSLKQLACFLLWRAGKIEEFEPNQSELDKNVRKRYWRRRTRHYPCDALAWVELSLCEVIPRPQLAKRSMLAALQLAPNHRHVLRSACRLFLHLDETDRAYSLVSRNTATPTDPWLIAAELAVSELASKQPRFFKEGRRMVENGSLAPLQISELSGALGTLEFFGGKNKIARNHFRDSLLHPTGNALAQAEWAASNVGMVFTSDEMFEQTKEIEEARAFNLFRSERYEEVAKSCMSWSEVEPYSIRPFEMSSSTTAAIGDYEKTRLIAQDGLRRRRHAPILQNNLAFALANLGKYEEAIAILDVIDESDTVQFLIKKANRGLIEFKKDNTNAGLDLYLKAISGFERISLPRNADVARLYLARESARSGLPQSRRHLEDARKALKRLQTSTHAHILHDAERFFKEQP